MTITLELKDQRQRQATALARLRGVSVAEAVLWLFDGWIEEALEDADDIRHAEAIMAEVDAGARTYTHAEVLAMLQLDPAELDQLLDEQDD